VGLHLFIAQRDQRIDFWLRAAPAGNMRQRTNPNPADTAMNVNAFVGVTPNNRLAITW